MGNISVPSRILGKHALYDLSGCDASVLNNAERIRSIALQAADIARITVLGSMDHHFVPQGYSLVLILEESHLSIHTWPEHDYVAIDLFSCSLQTDFEAVRDYLVSQFQPAWTEYHLFERGPVENPSLASPIPKSPNGHSAKQSFEV